MRTQYLAIPSELLEETPVTELRTGTVTNSELLFWGIENYNAIKQCNNDKRAIEQLNRGMSSDESFGGSDK